MKYKLSRHAIQEMQRRKIPQKVVDQVLTRPQQIISEGPGKKIYQSKIDIDGKLYLVRVVVAEGINLPVVVTVYRTTKIVKYWR